MWDRLLGLARMLRMPNCAMMGFAVIVGEVMALAGSFSGYHAALGFTVGFTLLGASMITNDIFDAEIDARNNPGRPIPAGLVTKGEAWIVALGLIVIGLVTSALINLEALAIASLSVVLMLYYNSRGKMTGVPGNSIVSVNVAIPFVFGGYAVSAMNQTLALFALLAFLSSLGREIAKGISDIAGDASRGVKTVAVIKGPATAARLTAFFFMVAVALSFLPPALGMVSVLYIPIVLVCDFGFAFSSYRILSDPTPANARIVKNQALIWMLFGLLAFIAGAYRIA